MNNVRIRLSMLIGSAAVIVIDLFFLWVLNLNETQEIQQMLRFCILILGGAALITAALFFIAGPVISVYGQIETGNIMAMMISVLVVIQLAFAFAVYSQKDQELRYEMYGDMRRYITELEGCDGDGQLKRLMDTAVSGADSIVGMEIVDSDGSVYLSAGEELTAAEQNAQQYEFPFLNGSRIVFHVSENYRSSRIFDIWLNLMTTLVISVFFSVEMVWCMIGVVSRKSSSAGSAVPKERPSALRFVRQIAFLFYFASRMSAAFIPIMAKSLDNDLFNMDSNVAAGIPQSAETLLTCVAIFAATELLTRKGWKLPFMAGLGFVALGTFLSAMAQSLLIFIAARAVVGLGYGFCWMTLRNLALFGQNDSEKTWGFSMLNAGLYAGMNCGSALGSILAERFGYRNIFLTAVALTLLCSIFIMMMENAVLPKSPQAKEKKRKEKSPLRISEKLQVLSFSVFMIAPSCIVGSYLSYYLPLYYESMGRSVSDVGRAQLIYGLIIVYAGPFLSSKIISKSSDLLRANLAYNIIFSAGLLIAGIWGGIAASIVAVLCIGIADSFGFGVQNNYFLALPAVSSMNQEKSLSYLSFLKKMIEMLGPTAYSVVILLGFEQGLTAMGLLFTAAVLCYGFTRIFTGKRKGKA
ncbi:MAG: MFS transporter [Oscillospiraceae bacterium]|nr:MFS transporter [Oscillospiraceae bacterium]